VSENWESERERERIAHGTSLRRMEGLNLRGMLKIESI
jgi:hypothetical protein